MLRLDRSEIARGAIYRYARKRRLDRKTVANLLNERGGLSEKASQQLASHWFACSHFREARCRHSTRVVDGAGGKTCTACGDVIL